MTAPSGSRGAAGAIYRWLGPRRQRQLLGTLALMVVGAFAETATVGAVLPFLAIVTGGSQLGGMAWLTGPLQALAQGLGTGLLPTAAGVLVGIAVCATGLRLLLLWISQRFVYAVAHDLAQGVFSRALGRPYAYHVMHNSAETLAAMEKVQFVLGNVLLPVMAGGTAAVVALCILAALLAIDPVLMAMAALAIVVLYVLLSRLSYRRLHHSSDVIALAMKQRVQIVQEGLGGIREVLLDRLQPVFLAQFAAIDDRFREAQASSQFLAAAPRFVVETAGVVMIAVVAVVVSERPGGLTAAIPVLGALALGAQRLLPLVQQVYFSWSQIYGHRATLIELAGLLTCDPSPVQTQPSGKTGFTDTIRFEQVTYTYPGTQRAVLAGIDLDIARGARIGLIGPSGSGKSTCVDLLLGLLDPTGGRISIDGRALTPATVAAWQEQVAHVPQTIFLADSCIAANVAFGQRADAIDMARVRDACRQAGIDAFIAGLPDGYDTAVGERGVRLSGGQRQRIGIARALYKQAALLVFDEATSALDDATEAAVMASIADLPRSLTMVIIAHRLTTLRQCDRIIRLDEGRIADVGRYDEVIARIGHHA